MTTRIKTKKKSTSIYPAICSRMEDKLFQFYRNECFMSCPCFSDSVLNFYILPNAWVFSTRNALWTIHFLGFQSQNTGSESAVTSPSFAELGYFPFLFKINRKKNPLVILCSEKTTIAILAYFVPISFSMHHKFCFPLPARVLYIFLFTFVISQ